MKHILSVRLPETGKGLTLRSQQCLLQLHSTKKFLKKALFPNETHQTEINSFSHFDMRSVVWNHYKQKQEKAKNFSTLRFQLNGEHYIQFEQILI